MGGLVEQRSGTLGAVTSLIADCTSTDWVNDRLVILERIVREAGIRGYEEGELIFISKTCFQRGAEDHVFDQFGAVGDVRAFCR